MKTALRLVDGPPLSLASLSKWAAAGQALQLTRRVDRNTRLQGQVSMIPAVI